MRYVAALLAAALLSSAPVATAQEAKFTVNPTMARGPANAPVTIFEFSDYQ